MWSCETLAEGFEQVMGDAMENEEQQLLKRMQEHCINTKSSKSCQLKSSTLPIFQEKYRV